jgi:hypothetical protein
VQELFLVEPGSWSPYGGLNAILKLLLLFLLPLLLFELALILKNCERVFILFSILTARGPAMIRNDIGKSKGVLVRNPTKLDKKLIEIFDSRATLI